MDDNAIQEIYEQLEDLDSNLDDLVSTVNGMQHDYRNIAHNFMNMMQCVPEQHRENIHSHTRPGEYGVSGIMDYHTHDGGTVPHHHGMEVLVNGKYVRETETPIPHGLKVVHTYENDLYHIMDLSAKEAEQTVAVVTGLDNLKYWLKEEMTSIGSCLLYTSPSPRDS